MKLFGAQRIRETVKPLKFLELLKAPFDCGGKTKAAISGFEASRKKFTGPKKGQFPENDDAFFKFFSERRKTGLFVGYNIIHKEAIKKGQIFEHSSKSF